jgi:hypothetical protein
VNALQHQTHQGLLTRVDAALVQPARMDAIIVPNGRPAPYLEQAIGLAKEHSAHLLLMCSLRADASSAALMAKRAGVRVTAIDIDPELLPPGLVPEFATDKLLRFSRFQRYVDTSFKRNLGLLIATLAGWERILFLDDDIVLRRLPHLGAAAGLLAAHPVVGLANEGMPDNSVVCHALRDIGEAQDTFIGGGALAVGAEAFGSFFPNIYNEDWFFLLDEGRLRPSAVTGTAFQYDYDPYRDGERARGEELGDTLAEGVFGLLDNGDSLAAADARYWDAFLLERRRIISTTIDRVGQAPIDAAQKARMIVALKAAIGRSHLIKPELCVQYLKAWQTDCLRWRRHVDGYPRNLGIDGALATLGLAQLAQPGVDGRIRTRGGRRSAPARRAAWV